MSVLRPRVVVTLPVLGALSVGLYYWYAAPGLAAAYWAPVVGPMVIRAAAAILITAWLWQAFVASAPGSDEHGAVA